MGEPPVLAGAFQVRTICVRPSFPEAAAARSPVTGPGPTAPVVCCSLELQTLDPVPEELTAKTR